MLAYNKETLMRRVIQQQAGDAHDSGLLSTEQLQRIKEAYPVHLYTPNLFVKIGLGLLTLVAGLAAIGLAGLVTSFSQPRVMMFLATLGGIACVEWVTRIKSHFNSGVDNMLMVLVALCFTTFVYTVLPRQLQTDAGISLLLSIVCLAGCLRYTDGLMAAAGAIAFYCFLLFSMEGTPLHSQPGLLLLAGVSVGLYVFTQKLRKIKTAIFYESALLAFSIIALAALYLAGNNYVVFQLLLKGQIATSNTGMVLATWWCCWVWSVAVPVFYIAAGIKNKKPLLLRLGVIAMAASIFTFRYYFAVLSTEAAMLLAGMVLTGVAWALVKYLQQPRQGFTSQKMGNSNGLHPNLEGVIVGEVFGVRQSQAADERFGGGSFGGAGAGSNF